MNGSERPRPIWFVGDLGDSGSRVIASALPRERTRWIDAPGDLPRRWPGITPESPRVVVLHRGILQATDGERVARLRERLGGSRPIILCVGPHVRYAEIDRWMRWVDVVLTETAAAETIVRHVQKAEGGPSLLGGATGKGGQTPESRSSKAHRTVSVVSTNPELRATLAALLRSGGYEVIELVQLEDSGGSPGVATVWDVPVLEPTWTVRLATKSVTVPVVALLGFLDRTTANLARASRASACLDLPCDLADLMGAVDRIAGIRRDPAHISPPAPMKGASSRSAKRTDDPSGATVAENI